MAKIVISDSEPLGGYEEVNIGDTPIDERIEILTKSLKKGKDSFRRKNRNITNQIKAWSFISLIIVLSSIWMFICFFEREFDNDWTWQYIYYTAIRITAISALFFVASFSFNMLKSAVELYQKNKTKLTIIDSMASFVESGVLPEDRKELLKKIIGIIVDSDFVEKEMKSESINNIDNTVLIELFKKLLEQK